MFFVVWVLISCPMYRWTLWCCLLGSHSFWDKNGDKLYLSDPSGIYSSLKDPLTLGGGVCSTPLSLGGGVCSTSLSLGGGMCSTPLSSGLLTSHVSSLSLPSVNAVSNTQVLTKCHSAWRVTILQVPNMQIPASQLWGFPAFLCHLWLFVFGLFVG